jgi:hypothetical protein
MFLDDENQLLEDAKEEVKIPLMLLSSESVKSDSFIQECMLQEDMGHHLQKIGDNIKRAGQAISNVDVQKSVQKTIRSIYSKSDDELVNNSKSYFHEIKRWLVLGTMFLVNPVLGLAGWLIDKNLRHAQTKEQKEELLFKLKTEVKVINSTINEEPSSEKRANLIRLREKYLRAIDKISNNPVDIS